MGRIFKLPVKVGKEVGENIVVLIDPDELVIFFLFSGGTFWRFPSLSTPLTISILLLWMFNTNKVSAAGLISLLMLGWLSSIV